MKKTRLFAFILSAMVTVSGVFGSTEVMAASKGVKRGDFTVYGSVSGSSFKNDVLTVSGNGTFTIEGNGRYTDDRIVITSSGMPKIKLKNIRIKSDSQLPAIEIKGRKGADLVLEGFNHANSSNNSAIRYTGNESMIISGKGSLKVDTSKAGSYGIYCMNGKLEIKSGTISSNSPIKAKEVKISGGVINAGFGSTVLRNGQNKRVYKQTVTIDGAKNKKVGSIQVRTAKGKNYNYSYQGMRTDEEGKMNVYLPDNTAVVSANVGQTLYSLENTAKAAASIMEQNGQSGLSSNILTGTETAVAEKLAGSTGLYTRVEAVNDNPEKAYTLMSAGGLEDLESGIMPTGLRGGGTPNAPFSTINIDVVSSGTAASAKEASIKVNGKAEVMVIEKNSSGESMFFDAMKKRGIDHTATQNFGTFGNLPLYSNFDFKFKWSNGDPSVADLQLPDGSKTLAVGKKPGKTLIRCDVSATYKKKELQTVTVPGVPPAGPTTQTNLVEVEQSISNFASIYLTLFVMPDLLDVTLEPTNANITVGGSLGESTAFLKAKVNGLTVSTPNEKTDVTINNVQYKWREVLPKDPRPGTEDPNDFLDIVFNTKKIDAKDNPDAYTGNSDINGFTLDHKKGLPLAHEVNVIAKKEGRNIKVGLTVYLKYTYQSKFYLDDGTVEDRTITVETELPEVYTVINIDDKGGITVDKNVLNLSINGKNPQSVDTVTAKMSGADTKLVDFKWWEYSGPTKASFIDFSNKKAIMAEPNRDDLKTLPIEEENGTVTPENKEKMRGSDGATITVQALEAGTTYLYVEGTYVNPDTGTEYKKETVVKVMIKDNSDTGSGGGTGGGGTGGGGGGTGGTGGGGQQNGNGDLLISELPNVVYNTKAHTPIFTVKSGINLLRQGVDFDYSFIDNIEAGTATLMINGKNQYDGFWAKKTFKIEKANLVIKNPILAVNTLRESNYTYDLSKLLPNTGMSPTDRANAIYKLGNSSLPKTNFSNITNGGNTSFLSFDAKGITTAGTQGTIQLTIESNPNFNSASVQLTVKSDSGMKVTFYPENGQDAYSTNVEPGSKVNPPAVPKKENYAFIGWYTNTGKQWNFDTDIVSSSIDLHAKWRDGSGITDTNSVNYSSKDGRITQEVIDRSVAEHRDLKVNVLDASGAIMSQWLFDSDRLGGKIAGGFDLSTDIYDAQESPAFNLLKSDHNDEKGIGISIGSGGDIPVGAMVRVKADPKFGGRKGRVFYLYKYDPDSHKLMTLPRRSKVKVDSEGYAQIPVIDSGDYILAAKRPKSSNIIPLIDQINTNRIRSGKVGSSKKIKLFSSPSLKKVNSLNKAVPYYYGAYTVKYSSSDNKIATVDRKGTIRYKKKGRVNIYIDVKLYHGISKRITQTITVK